MRRVIELIETELPEPITKRMDSILGMGVAMMLTAPLTMLLYRTIVIMVMFMATGILCISYALCSKLRIIREGYKTRLFRVYDYTFISRRMRSPTGMLMRPIEGNYFAKYHLAVNTKCGLPELGSVVKVYVPGTVTINSYGDRHYYPQVLGYEVVD